VPPAAHRVELRTSHTADGSDALGCLGSDGGARRSVRDAGRRLLVSLARLDAAGVVSATASVRRLPPQMRPEFAAFIACWIAIEARRTSAKTADKHAVRFPTLTTFGDAADFKTRLQLLLNDERLNPHFRFER